MKWNDVNSKFIQSIAYDDLTKELQVLIQDRTYSHYEVPLEVYEEFMNAPSKGTFYNKKIRGKYE